jgi:mRNA interferase MazF
MVINQGDIYWVQLPGADGVEPGIPHPHVVIQVNPQTVTLCALTSNIQRINLPGNVLLEAGEAGLPRRSVVEVSKTATIEKTLLGAFIGSLSEQRMSQILAGIRFVQRSYFDR